MLAHGASRGSGRQCTSPGTGRKTHPAANSHLVSHRGQALRAMLAALIAG